MKIQRLMELRIGQEVSVKHEDPETGEPREMSLTVERVEQATQLWQRGNMKIGDWVADLSPCGMEVRERFKEEFSARLPGLRTYAAQQREAGNEPEARRAEAEIDGIQMKLRDMEDVELYFVWGPGVPTKVALFGGTLKQFPPQRDLREQLRKMRKEINRCKR